MNAAYIEIDGRQILTYETEDGRIYQLGSLYHTDLYEKIWAETHISTFRHPKYFVYGIGSGSFFRALLNVADSDAVFVVCEPDKSIYELAMSSPELSGCLNDDRIHFMCSPSKQELTDMIISVLYYMDVQGACICVHPNYPVLFHDEYADFNDTVSQCARRVEMMYEALRKSGRVVTDNIIYNLDRMNHQYTIDALKEIIPPDIPLIIAAAGPSLDASIDYLRKAKGHAFIFSVDSALPTLMRNDIIPDMFISVDPIKELGNFIDPRVSLIPGIFPLSCNRHLFEFHSGPAFYYSYGDSLADYMAYLEKRKLPHVDADSSVSNHALGIGLFLQSRNIICTGLDLGYPNGMTHSSAAIMNGAAHDPENGAIMQVPCTSGGYVETNFQMDMYRQLFEERISKYPDINVINTSPDGALIAHTTYMSFRDALGKYCTGSFALNTRNLCQQPFNMHDFFLKVTKSQTDFLAGLQATVGKLTAVKDRTYSNEEAGVLIDACDNTFLLLNRHPELTCLCHCIPTDVHNLSMRLYEKTDTSETISNYIRYFEGLIDACEHLIPLEKEIFNL